MITRLFGSILLCIALILAVVVVYRNSGAGEVPLIFSPVQLLSATWLTYTQSYVEPNTYRTIDTQRGVTTSEGQSYTMLRSAWMADRKTFDGSWKWTQTNMYHTNDHLLAWLWGKKPDGTYGVLLEQNGETSASDADTDLALSLVFAYARWQDPQYLVDARNIIQDIWAKEVIEINGEPYLTADDLEKNSKGEYAIINPSYLSPAAYKIFAQVDPAHPWSRVADTSYKLLAQSIDLPFDTPGSAHLPPDWIQIDKKTGDISAIENTTNTSRFGFDALRVPYRVALDWEWFKDERAKSTLQKMNFLSLQWNKNHTLSSTYTHDGQVFTASEAPAMYGGTIGYFIVAGPASVASDVYHQKLVFLYDPGANTWKEPLSYYDDNWVWFGIALYNHLLPNLAASLPPSAFIQN